MNEESIPGGAATDDDERNERFLTQLRQKNDERRYELHRLHHAYEGELQQWRKEQSMNNLYGYNVARPPLEEHRIALEVEWQLLQESKEQEFVKTLVAIGSLFPQTDGNHGPSQAVVRHCLMQEYSEQVLHSYHDLAETHATLTKVLERESAKLELKQSCLKQQQMLLAEAKERLEQYLQETMASQLVNAENYHQKLQQQHQWIHGELHYICSKLGAKLLREKLAEAGEQQQTKKKRRHSTTMDEEDGTNDTEPTTLMETILLDLMQQLLHSPSSPYVSFGYDPKHEMEGSSDKRRLCRKDIINVLIVSGVAIPHPDDDVSIRLTGYQA
jgi:hypothetical protein